MAEDCSPAQTPAAVAAKPEGPGWLELLIGVGLIWAFSIAVNVGTAVIALISAGFKPQAMKIGPGIILLTSLLDAGWTLAVAWYILCRRRRRSVAAGFVIAGVRPLTLSLSVSLGLLAATGAFWLESCYGVPDTLMNRLVSTPAGLAAVTVLAMTIPLVEEMYYRGFLFPGLRRLLGAAPAIAIVTLWFAAMHVIQNLGDWAALGAILTVSLLLTLQRHLTGSLLPPLVTHLVYNGTLMLVAILSFLLSGRG